MLQTDQWQIGHTKVLCDASARSGLLFDGAGSQVFMRNQQQNELETRREVRGARPYLCAVGNFLHKHTF